MTSCPRVFPATAGRKSSLDQKEENLHGSSPSHHLWMLDGWREQTRTQTMKPSKAYPVQSPTDQPLGTCCRVALYPRHYCCSRPSEERLHEDLLTVTGSHTRKYVQRGEHPPLALRLLSSLGSTIRTAGIELPQQGGWSRVLSWHIVHLVCGVPAPLLQV